MALAWHPVSTQSPSAIVIVRRGCNGAQEALANWGVLKGLDVPSSENSALATLFEMNLLLVFFQQRVDEAQE